MTPRLHVVRFEPAPNHGIHTLVTGPTVQCAFETRACSVMMRHAGGFDEHHPWPISMGGATAQKMLILCPNHHRRQHSLVRYLVECEQADCVPDYRGVLIHFRPAERDAATAALTDWMKADQPNIDGWPCLAATAA